MKDTTLCILVRNNEVLLGIKKQKLGKGKYNGYGGHVEQGEVIEQAARRELKEEIGITATSIEKVGEIEYFFTDTKEWDQRVHIYLVKEWEGEPRETDEMTCEWFSQDNVPYDKMWDNDKVWLPQILQGKKVKGTVIHSQEKAIKCDLDISDRL